MNWDQSYKTFRRLFKRQTPKSFIRLGADPETFKKKLHTDHRMKKVFNSAYPLSHLFTNLILLISLFGIEEPQYMLKQSTAVNFINFL